MFPLLSAALGAALAYYGFAPLDNLLRSRPLWFLGATILLILPLSFLRVLAWGPAGLLGSSRVHRFFRRAGIHGAALAAGLSLGFGAANAALTGMELGLEEKNVTGLRGILGDDPRSLSGGQGLAYLELGGAAGVGGLRTSATGTAPVFFPADTLSRLQGFGRGSEVYVEGAFLSPLNSPGENPFFRSRSVHVLKPAPAREQFRTALRLGLIDKFSRLSSGGDLRPYGGLSLALLLGVRDNLDSDFAQMYRDAGCSHVLALSGMHLAVVSSIIAFFLRKPLGKKAAALLGAFFIVLYVLLVGPQPSLVRAALMYLLGALAVLGALPRRPLLLLAQAFLLQILTDPASGRAVSFILSYLALAGILIQGETIGELFRGKVPPVLAQGLAASLGAFIATGAVTAAFFGKLYPVGIVAGLLIVPLTTLFMILSLGILVIDLILPLLTGPLSAFLSLLYGILEQVVSLASRAPAFPVSSPLPALLLSGAAAVFLFLLKNHYLARRQRLVPFD